MPELLGQRGHRRLGQSKATIPCSLPQLVHFTHRSKRQLLGYATSPVEVKSAEEPVDFPPTLSGGTLPFGMDTFRRRTIAGS